VKTKKKLEGKLNRKGKDPYATFLRPHLPKWTLRSLNKFFSVAWDKNVPIGVNFMVRFFQQNKVMVNFFAV
jgi:hypothetical protein